MEKQTVEQRYLQEQIMKGEPVPSHVAEEVLQSQQQIETKKILQNMKHALQQTEQTVQQMKAAEGTNSQLMIAEQKLLYAQQQLQLLETSASSFSNGTMQQLTQLQLQIKTASGTLQTIQQTLGSN